MLNHVCTITAHLHRVFTPGAVCYGRDSGPLHTTQNEGNSHDTSPNQTRRHACGHHTHRGLRHQQNRHVSVRDQRLRGPVVGICDQPRGACNALRPTRTKSMGTATLGQTTVFHGSLPTDKNTGMRYANPLGGQRLANIDRGENPAHNASGQRPADKGSIHDTSKHC